MAKRTVYICDGDDGKCGAVLVNADDGFIFTGNVKNAAGTPFITQPAKKDGDTEEPETALCTECVSKKLGLPLAPTTR